MDNGDKTLSALMWTISWGDSFPACWPPAAAAVQQTLLPLSPLPTMLESVHSPFRRHSSCLEYGAAAQACSQRGSDPDTLALSCSIGPIWKRSQCRESPSERDLHYYMGDAQKQLPGFRGSHRVVLSARDEPLLDEPSVILHLITRAAPERRPPT